MAYSNEGEIDMSRIASEGQKRRWQNPEYRQALIAKLNGKIPWNKGLKHSEETKQKMSEARKRQNTKEYREQISHQFKGVIRSKKTRNKMSEAKKGNKNPAWRGGIASDEYPSDWTETLKRSIRERDNYECRICGKQQEKIAHHVHHIDLDKTNLDPENLITLCQSCHRKTYRHGELWINYFNNLISGQKEKVA